MKPWTLGSTFFLARTFHPSSHTDEAVNRTQAAVTILQWWRQAHLQKTAAQLADYCDQVLSLQNAQSGPQIEKQICTQPTITLTHNLLGHLEQAKNLVSSAEERLPKPPFEEQIFLAAYLIVSQPSYVFQPPTEIDEDLVAQAYTMLQVFEHLRDFMRKTYLEQQAISPHERMSQDLCFLTEGKAYLMAFDKAQKDYYQTYSRWESRHRCLLAYECINHYLDKEAKRFSILNNPDPRLIELDEGYGAEQIILRKRIGNLLGDKGLELLEEKLREYKERLDANKWLTASQEVLAHTLALNPKFHLSEESCAIQPRYNLDVAVMELSQDPPNIEPILVVFGDIYNQLGLFNFYNSRNLVILHSELREEAIRAKISEVGLQAGIYSVICLFIEKIKITEAAVHDSETNAFLDKLDVAIRTTDRRDELLQHALDFIYFKCSQINFELSAIYLRNAYQALLGEGVGFEQHAFQARIADKQFNLSVVLTSVDKIVKSPREYGLDSIVLCSQYLEKYIARAILIDFLQRQDEPVAQIIPETFYLDRPNLIKWHLRYQHIFYTEVAMGYFKIFSEKYTVKPSVDELEQQQHLLLGLLQTTAITTPKEVAQQVVFGLKELLKKHKKLFSAVDEDTLKSLVETVCLGDHPVAKIINKRLGETLSLCLFKEALPALADSRIKWKGLREELWQLGQEIKPVLRLHTNVHGKFYRQQVENRLWKPLFAILKETQIAELPVLLSSEDSSIKEVHCSLHKLAFALCGLAIIQQSVTYIDMWSLEIKIKNAQIKEAAENFHLIEMVRDPRISKDRIEEQLMVLMKDVAEKKRLIFDESGIAKMLKWAKNERSPGFKTFLDELLTQFKHLAPEEKELSHVPNALISEFSELVDEIKGKIKQITENIKTNNRVDEEDPVEQVIPHLRSGRMI